MLYSEEPHLSCSPYCSPPHRSLHLCPDRRTRKITFHNLTGGSRKTIQRGFELVSCTQEELSCSETRYLHVSVLFCSLQTPQFLIFVLLHVCGYDVRDELLDSKARRAATTASVPVMLVFLMIRVFFIALEHCTYPHLDVSDRTLGHRVQHDDLES